MSYAVGVVGTGPGLDDEEASGMSMGYRHAAAYRDLANCELLAAADVVEENVDRFLEHFDLDPANGYADYEAMVSNHELDVVSVTTPIPTHADIVVDLVRSGDLSAIHCEKPMASTWGDCRRMAAAAEEADVQLTFNHQLRFAAPVQALQERVARGDIGTVERVEAARGDLLEAGIHQVDLCGYFSGDADPAWVIGNVDYQAENIRHGVHVTDQGLGLWKYENGVHGLASTGDGQDAIGCMIRVIGSEGVAELDWDDPRIRIDGGDWESIDAEIGDPLPDAVAHAVECIGTDETPLLSADHALRATGLVFGVFESARRRGRVEFPLTIEDDPIQAMVDAGDLLR
jgi:predicted dehydrogenase